MPAFEPRPLHWFQRAPKRTPKGPQRDAEDTAPDHKPRCRAKPTPGFEPGTPSLAKPTPGFEPGTPSLRVKCSGQLSYVGAAGQNSDWPCGLRPSCCVTKRGLAGRPGGETSSQDERPPLPQLPLRARGPRVRHLHERERELLADAAEGLLLTRLPGARPDGRNRHPGLRRAGRIGGQRPAALRHGGRAARADRGVRSGSAALTPV